MESLANSLLNIICWYSVAKLKCEKNPLKVITPFQLLTAITNQLQAKGIDGGDDAIAHSIDSLARTAPHLAQRRLQQPPKSAISQVTIFSSSSSYLISSPRKRTPTSHPQTLPPPDSPSNHLQHHHSLLQRLVMI
ncbi:hypothetical protein Syun_023660 [Stephania yunnanensis]|uniref:Uncharacterized protein n=1 Tax=Stephania yunnanensis TaxID=152371 RepID=A0AAP0FPS2_9MAGN